MTTETLRGLPLAAVILLVLPTVGCKGGQERSDAYGNFEATEILVASEVPGRLVRFGVGEGDVLDAGVPVAVVDTTQLVLRRVQVLAQKAAVRSRLGSVAAQVAVLEEQKRVAEREMARVEGLLADGAATTKQRDDVDGQLAVLDRQIQSIRTQNAPIFAELDVLDAQLAVLEDQVRRSRILNPVRGTVIAVYAEESELTAAGRALYRIAPLDTLTLRAYVSGAQLPHVPLGSRVDVLVDEDRETNRALEGTVTWIASEAEFTPKPIQTKEERVDLVYAIKVRVPNPDGRLKIGMPGEVRFGTAPN